MDVEMLIAQADLALMFRKHERQAGEAAEGRHAGRPSGRIGRLP
jgi:hypothetical protein